MGIWPRVFEGVSVRHMTTHHSWAESVVIPDNVWVFGHLRIQADGNYRITVARNNYDDRGGEVDYQSAARLANLRGRVEMQFMDNYAGPNSSLTIGQVIVRGAN